MANAIFFILAAIAIASALMVVTRKNAVSAAVYLVITMCAIAGLFVQLGSIFIAALQVIVYAGAIMVLFLFVIMFLNLKQDEFGFDSRVFQRLFAVILGVVLLIELVISTTKMPFKEAGPLTESMGGVAGLSNKLFYVYLYPFEIIGVLLLAAIIGAVVIARRREEA